VKFWEKAQAAPEQARPVLFIFYILMPFNKKTDKTSQTKRGLPLKNGQVFFLPKLRCKQPEEFRSP
jgi:hypothetical protein